MTELSKTAIGKLETMGGARIGQTVHNLDAGLRRELIDGGIIDRRDGLTRFGSIAAAGLQSLYEERAFPL